MSYTPTTVDEEGDADSDDDDGKYSSEDDSDTSAVDDGCTENDIRAITHARRLVASGHIDMASRAVSTDHRTLDCNDSAVLQQLRQLHPAASHTPIPSLPLDAHTPLVRNDAALVHLIRRCNNGKAGGPSGWNGAMLAVLADSPTCMEGIRCIIADITTGRIPPAVRPHITASRLIALAKPNGAPRPIAISELFYRIAAVRAVRSVSGAARAKKLLAPHQYGVGVAGGCEHVVHCMQHSLSRIADNRPLAAVKIDISSAFNMCKRSRSAAQHAPARTAAPTRPLGVLTAHTAHTTVQRRAACRALHPVGQRRSARRPAQHTAVLSISEAGH